ncbi:PRC-barrel domain-containing protein [Candidatus Frackibacter sp. WG11]|nr:PRC-barrel domain-containing protein [Candidatus Frackibacter sp. WG11]SDB96846.1 PRC-barrel domain-containing protein [Candidatus Frackibacter sp. WG11]
MIKTSELQAKEVININDGQRLGMIKDIELDLAK